MKSAVWHIFGIVTVMIMSLMAWSIVIGVKESGYGAPSMFNNYSQFKEYVWYSLEDNYAEKYSDYTERGGYDYYSRTSVSWNSVADPTTGELSVTVEFGHVN